jgi:hypothetical protein
MQYKIITPEELKKASNAEKIHMMIEIIKGEAKYIENN